MTRNENGPSPKTDSADTSEGLNVARIVGLVIGQIIALGIINGFLWFVDSPWRFWWFET